MTLQGVTFCNSPSWTLHPYFSNDLKFIGVTVQNPSDSPNTDGLDPESCKNVEILGVRFSLGDDCIAVKSGKIYMGKKHKTPSENIHIRQCLMENGHGAVTLGSEMAGGVVNLTSYRQRSAYQDPSRQRKRCNSQQYHFPKSDAGPCDDTAGGQLLLFL